MAKSEVEPKKEVKKICGIIMPISASDGYTTDHWKDVYGILNEAISETEFTPQLVFEDEAMGLIHERIVTNIYYNDIVVCDVSSKNPNVMFELGMRLAFDKPTIIIKDDITSYSFDTGVIEHLQYPFTLRFNQIVKFKFDIKKRIEATYKKSTSEPGSSPFLKAFKKNIVAASIPETSVTEGKYILEELQSLKKLFSTMDFQRKSDLTIKGLPVGDASDNLNSAILEYVTERGLVKAAIKETDVLNVREMILRRFGFLVTNEVIRKYLEKLSIPY